MGLFGNNCKVHFAGSDGQENFYAALNAADVGYRLYSCYKYIVNKKPDSDFTLPYEHVIRAQCREQKHVIQDSGIFTFMFGVGKGQPMTLEILRQWQDKMVAFVQQNDIDATLVEIDCQKVLDGEEAWDFRGRMKKLLPHHRHMNVWHFEDGRKGLDRLIEFSDYLAVGLPEWRRTKKASHKDDVRYITHYIKNKKPEIDIHLLGCTDARILKENSFCTSSDSTSWLAGVKYGTIDDGFQKRHIRNFKRELFEARREAIIAELAKRGVTSGSRNLDYTTNASLCATICKNQYSLTAGTQN